MPGEFFWNGINSNRATVYDDHFIERLSNAIVGASSSAALLGAAPPPKKRRGPPKSTCKVYMYYLPDMASLPKFTASPPDDLIHEHSTNGYGKVELGRAPSADWSMSWFNQLTINLFCLRMNYLQVKNQGLYLQGSRVAQKFKNHGFKLKTMVSNSDGVPFD